MELQQNGGELPPSCQSGVKDDPDVEVVKHPLQGCIRSHKRHRSFNWIKPATTKRASMDNKRSIVWKFFTPYVAVANDGTELCDGTGKTVHIVKCCFDSCRHKELAYNTGSTKSMIGHLLYLHWKVLDEESRAALQSRSKIAAENSASPRVQPVEEMLNLSALGFRNGSEKENVRDLTTSSANFSFASGDGASTLSSQEQDMDMEATENEKLLNSVSQYVDKMKERSVVADEPTNNLQIALNERDKAIEKAVKLEEELKHEREKNGTLVRDLQAKLKAEQAARMRLEDEKLDALNEAKETRERTRSKAAGLRFRLQQAVDQVKDCKELLDEWRQCS